MTDRSLKLAIVMPGFFEQIVGGSEYQAYLLAERATAAGIEVHYVYMDNGSPCANALGIQLHPLKQIKLRKTFGYIWSLYYLPVMRAIHQINPDVLYVRAGKSWAAMTARFARKHGARSIWHVASSADVTPCPTLQLLRRPFDLIERKSIEYAIRHSTHVVSHAHFQEDLLRDHYGRASEVILKMQPEPTEALNKEGEFTVVWVSNIKPLKQPEVFCRLARELQASGNVRLIMIGRPAGGRHHGQLEAEVRSLSNLEYLGEQPIEKVNALLARSHVFVNTSTYEGLPNTFVQAWMREVPVVSMLLDPDNILKEHEIGYYSGSFEQMVTDIRRLEENRSLRNEMGRRAREYALANHSLEKNMGRLLELIRS